ncbi:tail fiber protein [Pseudomonas sp. RAC1]|uniref:phage tail protein n=1 Tax=Pseudomonas sp. RAC1 TaxID=3064900 RepID=UPI00272027EF|nr:tail fiber protein [Pseudomonas sp. RAC1]MDV9033636.1 tail fiber protein [Pseudomonas sp. RAC1]
MKLSSQKSVSALALSCALGFMAWSPSSSACNMEPYIASVCVMAFGNGTPQLQGFGNNQYVQAAGQTLNISQYNALFALIGTTYGGDGRTNFMLPDLRGRVIVGFDSRNTAQPIGKTGGAVSLKLSIAQLPPHALPLNNLPVSMSTVTATTTLSSLSATANLSGVKLVGPTTGLKLNGSSSGGTGTPGGNLLGKSGGAQGNLYSTAGTPDAVLNAASISGDLTMTVNDGITAPVTVTGNATTTLNGSAQVSGATGSIGGGADVPTMPPYLVMPYFIAVSGIFPSNN